MQIKLGYGDTFQELIVPDANLIDVLAPNRVHLEQTGRDEVLRALTHPIGSGRLGSIVKPGEKVAIITSDITRPCPSSVMLPPLLDELFSAGVNADDITVVFALGSHRPHTPGEMKKLAGEHVYNRVRCVDSTADTVRMGYTKNGTPVDVTRVVASADRRICLANIEYHYFAGYSGGAKTIMPGVSSREAIQANHSLMVQPGAIAGLLEGNPVRADIEEAAKHCPIDFILNVVLDEHKAIIRACAGHYIAAHREGCGFLDSIYKCRIAEKADIVVVSQSGAPKDLNLYQTQKALDNAKHAVKKGGQIILVGCCREGMGEAVFTEWMTTAPTPESLVDRIRREFRLGGHKAAAIALVLRETGVSLVSDMDPDFVRSIFLTPYSRVQTAFDDAFNEAFNKHGREARVLVMPYGGSTLPVYIA